MWRPKGEGGESKVRPSSNVPLIDLSVGVPFRVVDTDIWIPARPHFSLKKRAECDTSVPNAASKAEKFAKRAS